MWRSLSLATVLLPAVKAAGPLPAVTESDAVDYVVELHRYFSDLAASNQTSPEVAASIMQALRAIKNSAAPQDLAAQQPVNLALETTPDAGATEAAVTEEVRVDRSAFTLFGPGEAPKFRVVVEGPESARARPSAASRWGDHTAPSNPFLFRLDGRLLRYAPKPSLCASIREGRVREHTDVILWTCQQSAEFEWVIKGEQITVAGNPSYCLALRDSDVGPGSRASLRRCADASDGLWVQDGQRIRYSANKNLCLSVREGLAGDGSDLILWACDQVWRTADWVVVGGGASGCAAAAALVDAGESVVVIERGQSDRAISETQQAQTWPRVVNTEAAETIRWTDGTWGAVANVLGGGTSINGGLYIEEQPEYFQAALGADVDLEALYQGSRYLAANLTTPLQPSTYGRDFGKALQEVGLSSNGEPRPQVRWSDGSWVAFSTINTAGRDRWPRRSAAVLLHERAHQPNLEVLTEYLVKKVVFNGNRSTGVRVTYKGTKAFIPASKGVILAAGAIYTPQLLQVSGVGEASLLRNLGVDVVSDVPVGKNFIDRPVSTVGVWSGVDLPLHVGYAVDVDRRRNITTESEAGGRVASEFTIASLAFAPPAQRNSVLRWTFELIFKTPVADLFNNMMQLVALQHSPKSRGQVQAVSVDASVPPKVTANHLSDPKDMAAQVAALDGLLTLAGSRALDAYVRPKVWSPPMWPLPDFLSCFATRPAEKTRGVVFPCPPAPDATQSRWQEFARNTVVSSYHYFGTASMGSVVEGPDFLVKGTANLHVVDASVLPLPTRVNPQGTIMAVGHYAGKRIAALGAGRRLSEEPQALAMPTSMAGALGEVHV